jgi:hypothetical protein
MQTSWIVGREKKYNLNDGVMAAEASAGQHFGPMA